MTISVVRTALQTSSSCYVNAAFKGRITSRITGSLRRSLSTESSDTTTSSPTPSADSSAPPKQGKARLIPTRHSSKAPPPICKDPVELKDRTQELLETPVGSMYCQNHTVVKTSTSPTDDRDNAYAIARESGDLVEYLLRGYNRTISPLSLCGNQSVALEDPEQISLSLEAMVEIMERFQREGEMFLKLRSEALTLGASDSDSESDSDSDSSDSDSSDDEDDLSDDIKGTKRLGTKQDDFAMPGVTTAMYDTILDAMACASTVAPSSPNTSYLYNLEPEDLYRVAGAAWKAHDLNNQYESNDDLFHYTAPTMVTYNATLRGIGNLCSGNSDSKDERQRVMIVDQGLACGFGVYNHLTHNNHGLPKRNSASIIYLLKVIEACIPTSRTRGNMTVALWHQASKEGLVTPELISTIKDLHVKTNGPEFDIFLESLDTCTSTSKEGKTTITPQRFSRFAKKCRYSKFY